jgi:predicted nucleic acid-binding protein
MGVAVLDSSVLIGVLDAADAHHQGSVAAVRSALRDRHVLVVPAVAYAEVLVGAIRKSGSAGQRIVDDMLAALPATVAVLDEAIAARAAALRARHTSLRLPDALAVGTALAHREAHVVTADRGWPKGIGCPVALVS